ncbi:hypothetical protein C2G38_2201775 [Gigaspora rosea]|uniref:Uncharacterized protein n=1 Tax=Gigaspora rosea TaxID=44941 RepID=A0A397UP65_9GLOM|nr:hypothetical protein C2G38_2201775 [Gigaspora rosea]
MCWNSIIEIIVMGGVLKIAIGKVVERMLSEKCDIGKGVVVRKRCIVIGHWIGSFVRKGLLLLEVDC